MVQLMPQARSAAAVSQCYAPLASFVQGPGGGLQCRTWIHRVSVPCKRHLTEQIASHVLPGQVTISLQNLSLQGSFPWGRGGRGKARSRTSLRSSAGVQGKPGACLLPFSSGVAATLCLPALPFLSWFLADRV